MKASNPAGFTLPWVWTRRRLAQAWGVPPWVVDAAPWYEVNLELQLGGLENEAVKFKKRFGIK